MDRPASGLRRPYASRTPTIPGREEGFVGKNFLRAWPIEDLIQFNKDYFVDVAARELFLFGSSGGGETFAFDTRSSPPPIVAVPFIVCLEDAIAIVPNFNSFLQHLYQSESLFPAAH